MSRTLPKEATEPFEKLRAALKSLGPQQEVQARKLLQEAGIINFNETMEISRAFGTLRALFKKMGDE